MASKPLSHVMVDSNTWSEIETIYGVVAAIFIIGCVYVPLISYHGKKYHSQRKHIVYVKRFADIVLYEVYISIFKSIIICIGFAIPWMHRFDTQSLEEIGIAFITTNSALTFGLFYCWVWRFWMLHYNLQWTELALHNQWQSLINKNHYFYSSNHSKRGSNPFWYIENKKRCGNSKWCRNKIILPLLLLSILYVILQSLYILHGPSTSLQDFFANGTRQFESIILWIYGFIIFVFPYIALMYIYFKTRLFQDKFYICWELKRILIVFTFEYLLTFALFFLIGISSLINDDAVLRNKHLIIYSSIISIFLFGAETMSILITTWWVNSKVEPIIDKQQWYVRKLIYDTSNINRKQNSDILSIEFSVNSSIENAIKKNKLNETNSLLKSFGTNITKYNNGSIGSFQLNLIQIVGNNKAFLIFVKCLLYELSLENLTFFIEIMQYQQCIYNKFVKVQNELAIIDEDNYHEMKSYDGDEEKSQQQRTTSDHLDLFRRIEFCEVIPISSIVEDITHGINIDYEYNTKLAAKELYQKYVCTSAEYQINIEGKTRSKLDKLFSSKDGRLSNKITSINNPKSNMEGLLHLFDQCLEECVSLMMDSYQRIETSSNFEKIKDALAGDDY